MLWRIERFGAVILLILSTLLPGGCTVTSPYEDRAIRKDLLQDAGFHQLDLTTPKRKALLDDSPKWQFVSYKLGDEKYYVYADEFNLYMGNEAAYQKYLSMVKNKRLCQSLDATDWGPFWSCFEEYQKGGSGK